MPVHFETTTLDEWCVLVRHRLWTDRGIQHGFLGLGADFANLRAEKEFEKFSQKLNGAAVLAPDQVHGNGVVELKSSDDVVSFLRQR